MNNFVSDILKNETKKSGAIYFLIVLTLVVSFDFVLSKRVFPVTEGWWETYAWLITKGQLPYADFSLKFPPLYVYYNLFLIKIFGFDFFKLRLVAIALHSLVFLGVYLWLRNFTSNFSAGCGAILAASLVMLNPVYFAKDYHTLVSVFIIYTILAININTDSKVANKSELIIKLCISGFLCGLLLITKQNIGVFFSLAVLLYWFCMFHYFYRDKALYKFIYIFMFLYFVPALVLSALIGTGWMSIFLGNDSKGGASTVLFRFLVNPECIKVEFSALFLITIAYLAQKNVVAIRFFEQLKIKLNDNPLIVLFSLVSLFFIVVFYGALPAICIALAWPIIKFFLFKNKSNLILTIPLYGLAYCGTQTAGFNFVSMEFLLAMLTADVVHLLLSKKDQHLKYFIPFVSILFVVGISQKVLGNGYNWWGLGAGGVLDSSERLPFKEFDNITTDKQTAKMFSAISDIKVMLENKDDIFSYPSTPLVYELLNRKPLGAPVLWFDVASTSDGKKTLELLDTKLPKYIFWLKPPRYVYTGHYGLRKKDSAMLDVDNWLFKKIHSGEYEIIKTVAGYNPNALYYSQTNTELSMKDIFLYSNKSNSENLMRNIDYCLTNLTCQLVGGNVSDGIRFRTDNYKTLSEVIELSNVFSDADIHVFYILKHVEVIRH